VTYANRTALGRPDEVAPAGRPDRAHIPPPCRAAAPGGDASTAAIVDQAGGLPSPAPTPASPAEHREGEVGGQASPGQKTDQRQHDRDSGQHDPGAVRAARVDQPFCEHVRHGVAEQRREADTHRRSPPPADVGGYGTRQSVGEGYEMP
jgi:hypothetical protein